MGAEEFRGPIQWIMSVGATTVVVETTIATFGMRIVMNRPHNARVSVAHGHSMWEPSHDLGTADIEEAKVRALKWFQERLAEALRVL